MTSDSETAAAVASGKPALFVHIGFGKTGSTTIQRVLQAGVDTLRENGLLLADGELGFPESGPVDEHPLWIFAGMLPEDPGPVPDESIRDFHRKMEALRGQLADGGYRGAIISSEVLAARDGFRLFAGLRDQFAIHTLFYVRRQDEWIQSGWKQWGLKSGQSMDDYAEECMERGYPCYLNAARQWRKISDSIRVVPLNGTSDIVRECLDWLGLADYTPEPLARQNQSFDWSILKVLQNTPFVFSHRHDNTIFNLLERHLPEDCPRDGGGFMSLETGRKIQDHFRAENEALQAEFFPEKGMPDAGETKGTAEHGIDPVDSLFRFQGFQLLMLNSLTRDIDKLNESVSSARSKLKVLKSVKKENAELRKKTEHLLRRVEELDKKMARSWKWRLKKLFGKS